ncbi:hypothetical protein [Kutzneria albida]|uniref:Bacterial EndoU nuclease domain-containing protein n=1 Tax=Kutzneria albida DSM 43870 TaxID=1449976 RepID=W5WEA2_9PSEU|nr:hypothetical protein [Kutzneria albida]AHH99142.1 hypothetical protein KALB_5781 [Kutzneria albida DSM 43870]
MFTTGDEITFSHDQWRRLRITMLPAYRPLAAWLHTDVQPNLAALDQFAEVLGQAATNRETVNGNGCWIEFRPNDVVIGSLYDRWEPLPVPTGLFWPVLSGLRGFLLGAAAEPGLTRPDGYPAVSRMTTRRPPPTGGRPVLVDRTYFPPEWSEQQVQQAAAGAWGSAEALYDEHTGTWSGLWCGGELAGYYDPATGTVQSYFPVLAP